MHIAPCFLLHYCLSPLGCVLAVQVAGSIRVSKALSGVHCKPHADCALVMAGDDPSLRCLPYSVSPALLLRRPSHPPSGEAFFQQWSSMPACESLSESEVVEHRPGWVPWQHSIPWHYYNVMVVVLIASGVQKCVAAWPSGMLLILKASGHAVMHQ